MAAPQTHAWISLGLAWLLKLKGWDFWGAMSFGVFIDVDHFTWDFMKDTVKNRITGGDNASEPGEGVRLPGVWLHKWPMIFLLVATPLLLVSISWWVPALFFGIHWVMDKFQQYRRTSFWYPLRKGEFIPPFGYPVKKRTEFILASTLLAGEAIVFYLQWHPPW